MKLQLTFNSLDVSDIHTLMKENATAQDELAKLKLHGTLKQLNQLQHARSRILKGLRRTEDLLLDLEYKATT